MVEDPRHFQGKARHVSDQVVFIVISPSRIQTIELGKQKSVQLSLDNQLLWVQKHVSGNVRCTKNCQPDILLTV